MKFLFHPRFELGIYVASRICNSVVSLSIFAIIAKKLTTEEADSVFFLLFIFGFAVSLLRNFCMLNTNLVGQLQRTQRLRRIASGAQSYIKLLPVAVLLLSILFSFQSLPWWACPIFSTVAYAAGYDSDLKRAVLVRPALYSFLMFSGSTISFLLLILFDIIDLQSIIETTLLIWIPAALVGISSWIIEIQISLRRKIRNTSPNRTTRALLIASLEGIILNAPFLGGTNNNLNSSENYDLALSIRIFSSSQALFSLINHWSNSGRLWQFGKRINIKESTLYSITLILSSLISSIFFIFLYNIVSEKFISSNQYFMFILLIFGYSFYLGQTRFNSYNLSSRMILFIYSLVVSFFLILVLFSNADSKMTFKIALVQGGTLFLIALIIKISAVRNELSSQII